MNRSSAFLLLTTLLLASVSADETKTTPIRFESGKSEAVVSGTVTGRDDVVYTLNARDGQFLEIQMLPEGRGADFNVYIPGRGPGDEALYTSSVGGREYLGQLDKSGDHTILVFQNRAAARRGDTAEYTMRVRVTDKQPVAEEEVPATGAVPEQVVADCLAVLSKQLGGKSMKVLTATRGETGFVIDVEVEGVPNPWRCFHDGSKCTGTEYQGEG